MLAIVGMTLFLAIAWDDVLPSMRILWVAYVLLLILTGYCAWYDYLSGTRLRGPAANLAVLFGLPALVFLSAAFHGHA